MMNNGLFHDDYRIRMDIQLMGLLGFKHPGLDPALGVSGTSGITNGQ